MLILIPLRGIDSSMSRIRKGIDPDLVSTAVRKYLDTYLQILNREERVVFLTSDRKLEMELLLENYEVRLDDGLSLNKAIFGTIATKDYTHVLILMPDLPGFTQLSFYKILQMTTISDNFIVPSYDSGTNIAFLSKEFIQISPVDLYGPYSSTRIKEIADRNEIPLYVFKLRECMRDLDTVEDWHFWHPR